MKKRFLLSFSLILVMMSFIAVPLQTAHADGNINGNAHLTFVDCHSKTKQCKKLTLRFDLSGVNSNSKIKMFVRVQKNNCNSGQQVFIEKGGFLTKKTEITDHITVNKIVSLTVRDKDSLLFCLFRDKNIVARGLFPKNAIDNKDAKVKST